MGEILGAVAGPIAGGLVSGLFGSNAANSAADAQIAAGHMSAAAAERLAQPYNVFSPLGQLTFSGRQGTAGLTGPFQRILEDQVTLAQTPDRGLDLLRQLAQPQEDRARRETRERLFSQGRLGTRAGLTEISDLERVLSDADAQRQLQSIGLAQQAFNNALTLSQAPTSNLGALGGAPFGATGAAIGATGDAFSRIGQAAQFPAAVQSSFGQALGSAVGNIDFGRYFSDDSASGVNYARPGSDFVVNFPDWG